MTIRVRTHSSNGKFQCLIDVPSHWPAASGVVNQRDF